MIRRLILHVYCRPADGEGGDLGGSAPVVEAPAAAPAAPAAEAPAPASMLDALNRHWSRDELGRFASPAEKAAAEAAAKPADAQKPADPPKQPDAPEDITAMPDGLGQKAQERFQRLASTNRELTEKAQSLEAQVGYIRDTFQTHGIKQDQFEQAVGFIGAINRGDYQAVEQALLGQLQQLALLTGKNYGGAADPLASFPDLRQKVDGLQIAEADAIEVARLRQQQAQRQQADQSQRQQIEQEQGQQQAVQAAQNDIDTWWKQTASADLDAPAIEAQLLPHIPTLLQGVPPQSWARVVKAQYQILKNAAGAFRQSSGSPAIPTLRPTGAGAQPQARPQSMQEAMWGRRLNG